MSEEGPKMDRRTFLKVTGLIAADIFSPGELKPEVVDISRLPDISRYKGVGKGFYYSSREYKADLIKPNKEGVILAPRVVIPDSARKRGLWLASVLLEDLQEDMGIKWESASRHNMQIDLCTLEALDTEPSSYSWQISKGGILRYGFVRESVIENIMEGLFKEGRYAEVKLFRNDMHNCDVYSVNPDGVTPETARAE